MGSSNSFSASSVVASARGVYFNPEADSATAPGHQIEDGDLKSRMLDLIEGDEDIEDITIYSSQLMDGTVGGPLRFHAYVVIKTENWWWSLERIGEGTTIQRSKIKKYVVDYFRRQHRGRNNMTKVISDYGRYCMKDLVEFLHSQNLVYKDDHLLNFNCTDFAKAIFDRFAKDKTWDRLLEISSIV